MIQRVEEKADGLWSVVFAINGCGGFDNCCKVGFKDEGEFTCAADVIETL